MIKRNRTKNGHKNKAYNWRSRVILQLLCFYALIYIAEAFFVPYITAYYKLQGMTPLEIGILSSIGPICAIVVQPFWAIKSDRSGKRLTLLRKIIFMAAVSVMFFPVAKSFSSILFFNILFFSFQTSIVPLGNTMSASKLWNTGYDFSRVRVGGTLGYAFAAAISGPLVEHNQHWIFILTGAAYLLLLFVTLTLKEKGSNESSSELVRAQRYYGSGNCLTVVM
jgi:MFS family permease